MNTIVTDKKVVIVGLGKTGLSCVRFLSATGCQLVVMDSRENPPGIDELRESYGHVACITGGFDRDLLCQASEIILSPGVALAQPDIQAAIEAGVQVRGDIDLFASAAKAPIVAITGSNGKSTVTTLLGDIAHTAGLNVGVGGNLGTPALDLLSADRDLYILELSSFQLETTHRLGAEAAVLLNLSEDHMDRYESKMAYLQAKQRIFFGARNVVINDDDMLSRPLISEDMTVTHYGLNRSDINKFSTQVVDGREYLCHGYECLLPVDEMLLRGQHNVSNALAAMALASAVNISMEHIVLALKSYQGLEHRCQFVRTLNGVDYINDSKGTNVGATETAILSLGAQAQGKVVLIAGGESKDANMQGLLAPMKTHGRAALLIGRDAKRLGDILKDGVSVHYEVSLESAVRHAADLADSGDIVLLSPACASFDMFSGFEHRGEVFTNEVNAL